MMPLLFAIFDNVSLDGAKVQSIISETYGWNDVPIQSTVSNTAQG
jgi:hypothetical protein